jgi:predicted O-methyltransferase YrrM
MIIDGTPCEIPTWTEPATLEYLRSLARRCNNIVESGTYIGASASAMLEANPKLHLWTVDHFQAFAFNEDVTKMFLGKFIREGRCEIIVGNMERAGEMLIHMRGKIDAAFVDDGHAVQDVQRDIRNLLPLLKSGGILCGHDWDGDNDVVQGVKSMLPISKITIPVPRLWQYIKP